MRSSRICLFFVFALASLQAVAQKVHHVAIDLDLSGRVPLANALSTVENVRKAFSQDGVEVEVVCHGAGLDLLVARQNDSTSRIGRLQSEGVVFAACANTMKGRHVTRKDLVKGVVVVDAGSAELIRKQEAGWAYLKPG